MDDDIDAILRRVHELREQAHAIVAMPTSQRPSREVIEALAAEVHRTTHDIRKVLQSGARQ